MNTVEDAGKDKPGKIGGYLQDFYLRHLHLTKSNWGFYRWVWGLLDKSGGLLANTDVGSRIIESIMPESSRSQGHIVPINRDLNYEGKSGKAVAPISMVRAAIEESSYRMVMDKCMCRDTHTCQDYPIDHGCFMIGEVTRKMVESGVGHYVTVEEALAHLDRAAELGLVALCAWTEAESLWFGIGPDEHEQYFEVCMCCPCCCIGFHQMKKLMSFPVLKERFQSVGWRARGTDDCSGCGQCVEGCPMEAIELNADEVVVSDECIGCGLCAVKCPEQAFTMEEIEPMKDNVLDYFRWFRPRINE